MKTRLFKFFSSLKLAVFSILLLASVLAVATILESFYGMRAVHVLVYGTPWFAGVLILLGTNVLCAALSRYPWKRHQTGFVITHAGILILLTGSMMTQRFGVDGNLPVVEKASDNEVILSDLILSVGDEEGGVTETYPVPESATEKSGELLKVDIGEKRTLTIEKFLPRVVQQRKIQPSPVDGVGVPALELKLFNDRFEVEEWISASQPQKASELNLGPATVTFKKLWNQEDEKAFLNPKKNILAKASIGNLAVRYKGKEFRFPVEQALRKWHPLAGTELEVIVDRYLPYAVVEKNQLVSKSQEPINPTVQIQVRQKGNPTPEKHSVFAFFPEFSSLHGASKIKERMGVEFRFVSSAKPKEELGMVGSKRGALDFAQSADNTRLYYRVLSKDGAVNGQGEVGVGKPLSTGWMNLQFEVKSWIKNSHEDWSPRYVEYISGSGDNFLTAIYVKESSPNRANSGFWLYEGMGKTLSVGGRDVYVQFKRKTLALPFKIHLDKFTIGKNPGTNKAASYHSQVNVVNEGKTQASGLIEMNEPLYHGGYTFYQASYQMEEGRPPTSVFAVNFDPGRWVKYIGSLLIVLGAAVMFWMNPHYISIIMGKKA